MITTLGLSLAFFIQDPVATTLQAAFELQDLTRPVQQAMGNIEKHGRAEIRGIAYAGGLEQVREAGLDAIEVSQDLLDMGNAEPGPEEIFALVARLHGLRRAPKASQKRLDLQSFNKEMEYVYRDLNNQALAWGDDIDREAARFLSTIERVRDLRILDEIGPDEKADLVRRMERIQRVDRQELINLAARVVFAGMQIGRESFRERLDREPTSPPRSIEGIEGEVLVDRSTPYGRMIVGGTGRNRYDCSAAEIIVDLGGNDLYEGPAGGASEHRRMAAVFDFEGDDEYRAISSGLGSGTLGLGVLVDFAGKDRYFAESRCAGFGAGGIGVFMDLAGDDRYEIGDLSAGVGMAGIGVFFDAEGDDYQSSGVRSFGCGLPGGLGLFVDWRGKDERAMGKIELSILSQVDAASVGMGTGTGFLPLMPAGMGVFLDGAGDDQYLLEGFGLGLGMRGGVGLFRDMKGDDTYRSGAASMGSGFLKGIGLFMDDQGSDYYQAGPLSMGAGTASSAGWFLEVQGDDEYVSVAPSLGEARKASVAGFMDREGLDRYRKEGSSIRAESALFTDKGKAIGLFLDEGGAEDKYEFNKASAPSNGKLRLLESGRDPLLELLLLIDR
ncbi:MAG: hypothetical protein ACYTG5_09030 [Planctomycetota bacterium]|jgi:hypothetical protein